MTGSKRPCDIKTFRSRTAAAFCGNISGQHSPLNAMVPAKSLGRFSAAASAMLAPWLNPAMKMRAGRCSCRSASTKAKTCTKRFFGLGKSKAHSLRADLDIKPCKTAEIERIGRAGANANKPRIQVRCQAQQILLIGTIAVQKQKQRRAFGGRVGRLVDDVV